MKKELHRRSAIKPVIGHMKAVGKLVRTSAINSSINRFRMLAVLKMISSTVYLSSIFHWISSWAFEDFPDDGTVTGIGEGGKAPVETEVVEGCQNQVPISFPCLSVIFPQGEEEFQDLLLGNAGEVASPNLGSKLVEYEFTFLDGISFRVGSVVLQVEIDSPGACCKTGAKFFIVYY